MKLKSTGNLLHLSLFDLNFCNLYHSISLSHPALCVLCHGLGLSAPHIVESLGIFQARNVFKGNLFFFFGVSTFVFPMIKAV